MNQTNTLHFFFIQTDALGAALFCMLLLMSAVSWYFILRKSLRLWAIKKSAQSFVQNFWAAATRAEKLSLASTLSTQPHARLAQVSLLVQADLQAAGRGCEDALLRCMQRVVGEEAATLDNGQTVLASIAAVAPFVGLFGTVWGVHHALASIGSSGSATLDQVAGPVGEALIMTALGLAVAIPAVLAYNAFSRNTQMLIAGLDSFAHDLHHYLMTGKSMLQSLAGE